MDASQKEGSGFDPRLGRSVWSLRAFPRSSMHVSLMEEFKLTIGGLVTCPGCNPSSHPMAAGIGTSLLDYYPDGLSGIGNQ